MDTPLSVPADVSAQAEAFLSSEIAGTSQSDAQNAAPATATSTPVASQTPVAQGGQMPQSGQVASPAADQPTPLQFDDAKTYLWPQQDGTTAPMTGKDIKAGFLRQQDYTRKTQEAAQLRKQLEPYIAEREQVVGILRDPNAYLQFAAQHLGPQAVQQLTQALLAQQQTAQQAPQIDPNQIATVGDAQRYAEQVARERVAAVQQQLAAMEQQVMQRIEARVQGLDDKFAVQKHNERLEPAIKAVFEQHPILSVVPNAEESIRFEVFNKTKSGEITTPEQAIQAFQDISAKYATAINAKFQELNKQQLAAQQALVTNGIEPPGGALVQHQGPPKVPQLADGKVDWDKLGGNAEAFIRSQMTG